MAIRPLAEGRPSTDGPLQIKSVPSNVNTYPISVEDVFCASETYDSFSVEYQRFGDRCNVSKCWLKQFSQCGLTL